MNPSRGDTAFVCTIPQLYEQYLVPLILEPFAVDSASRVALFRPSSVLVMEIDAGAGAVRIDSTLKVGTTVSLYLPRHEGEVPVETRPPVEPASVARPAGKATVLLVDDEAPLRSLLAELLAGQGYAVLQAENGTAGLELLESSPSVDLLVCDVGLPGSMNGKQFAEVARTLRPALKVLFITGYADKAGVGNGLQETGMDVMLKPFRLDDFAQRVAHLLQA